MTKSLLYGATKVDETNAAYAAAASLEQFQWKNRVFAIFSDADNARAARQENQLLSDRPALGERDMVVLRIRGNEISALFGAGEDLNADEIRKDLQGPDVGDFAAVLVGKDGTVKLRVSEPIAAGDLFALIDSMPVRAAESLKPDV
jgi:hypothetical protein